MSDKDAKGNTANPTPKADGANQPTGTTAPKDQKADQTKIATFDYPSNWPNVRSLEEIDACGKIAAKWRYDAHLSNGVTVSFGSTSSTYRSKGSSGKESTDKTTRTITVRGKQITWQVYPLTFSVKSVLSDYGKMRAAFMVIDLYENYVKDGGSTSGIMIDAIFLTLSDCDMVHNVLTKLANVSEDEFKAYVNLCEGLRAYWETTTGVKMPIGLSVFDVSKGDGQTTPAAPKQAPSVTDLSSISWD